MNGIKRRTISESRDKFKINRKELIKLFEKGISNKDIAKLTNSNNILIATYKYKWKKGELKTC